MSSKADVSPRFPRRGPYSSLQQLLLRCARRISPFDLDSDLHHKRWWGRRNI